MAAPSARFFQRAGALALAGLMAVTAAACTPQTNLNQDPGVAGQVRHEQIWNGPMAATDGVTVQPDGTVLVIPASAIESGRQYSFQGALEVQGILPADCKIAVQGRVHVEGDVGAGCKISAQVPTAKERSMRMEYVHDHLNGGGGFRPRWRTKTIGPLYPEDSRPAISVSGTVGEGARLSSNHGISLGAADPGASIEAGRWGPGLTVTGLPRQEAAAIVRTLPPSGPSLFARIN